MVHHIRKNVLFFNTNHTKILAAWPARAGRAPGFFVPVEELGSLRTGLGLYLREGGGQSKFFSWARFRGCILVTKFLFSGILVFLMG